MADDEVCPTSTNFIHPRIIFIRLGKDRTKDAIQNKIFKGVRKALKDLSNVEGASKPDKNVLVLSSVLSRGVLDIAIGEQYVGLLLKDGRVCRFKCVCKNFTPSTKGKNTAVLDEPIFQVQSDEAYAKRLHEQLNSSGLTGNTSSLNEFNGLGESSFGLAQQPFRFGSLASESEVPTDSILNFTDSNFESIIPNETPRHVEDQSSVDQTQPTNSDISSDIPKVSNQESSSSKASNLPSSSSSASENSKDTLSKTSTDVNKPAGNLPGNSKSDTSLPSSNSTAGNINWRADNEPQNHISVTNVLSTRSQSSGYLSRRPPPSPTVVHRTILTADHPIVIRPSRPYFVSPHILIPSFSQVSSTPGVYIDARRLASNLAQRNQVRIMPRSGRRHLSSPYSTRRNQEAATSRREMRNSTEQQATEETNSDFNYPEAGDIEWLQTETGEEIKFSHIVALHTEFVLVEKETGRLYHWPYHSDATNPIAMETDIPDADFTDTSCSDTPKARVSHLLSELELHGEQVVIIAAQGIRCTLVTKSGKICTFYDNFFRENNKGMVPALIQQLSHPAVHFPELQGETITAVDCSEFFSSVMTHKGKIYWWGLLPSEERQDFKQKQNKENNNVCNISVNDKVQLRKHLPGFPGALVFKSSETFGPQLGRLLSHETDGTTQKPVKIKVEKIVSKYNSKASSRSNSPIVSTPSRIEAVLARGSASPMHTIAQETRSGSPHTNIKNLDAPSRSNPNIEVWDVNDVVFLESESKILGTVAAIDGPHVIVKVDSSNITSDTSLRVFKVSELESVSDENGTSHGASTSTIAPITTMYRGCIQNAPKCILDGTRSSSAADKEVLTEVNPVAMAATSAGISALVEHHDTRRAIFIGPVVDSTNSDKVFTCCEDMTTTRGSDEGCTTVDCESISSKEGGLDLVSVCPDTAKIGQKRKHPVSNDGVSPSDQYQGNSIRLSRVKTQDARTPSLHKSTGSNVILLCDNNGCLYPRPFGTKLSEPCAVELPPLHCLGLGPRLGFTSKCDTEEKILAVFLAFKEQRLIAAIQSGILSNVTDLLKELEAIHTNTYKGKSALNGSKKVAYDGENNQPLPYSQPKDEESTQAVPSFSQEILTIINEHTSSNQNALHVACTNPAYLMTAEQAKKPLETLLECLDNSGDSTKNPDDAIQDCVEVSIIDKLLHSQVFAGKFVPMLMERDAKGCTPFMLSIQSHNFKGALYILNYVIQHEGKYYGDCKISMETMIFPSTFSNITPLHALAIACTSNLPASGLGNSLTVSNLPSGYTPRILLKLFQANYPSAYRATIPPMVEAKKYPRAKTPRQRILELAHKEKGTTTLKPTEAKKTTLAPASTSAQPGLSSTRPGRLSEGGNRIPIVGSRRESIQGMVTFSDTKELRQALIEMDKHMVSSETLAPEGGLANLVQHVLHVKLTELDVEENEKLEMEVGIRGDVYNVSTSSGTTKISRKSQPSDANKNKEMDIEDNLICQLFSRLLSYSKMATARNSHDDTVLSFFVNNSRWIKSTAQQKQRLLKYSNKLFGSDPGEPTKGPQADRTKGNNDITAEIKIKGSSGTQATIESNLLAQLDEISSSFRSLVDTLAALEDRVTVDENGEQNTDPEKAPKIEEPSKEGAAGTSGDLIDLSSEAPSGDAPEKDENSLPILIQLAQNWPCVSASVLGFSPVVTEESAMEGLENTGNMDPKNVSGASHQGPKKNRPSSSCAIDGFVVELLSNTDKSVLVTFVETIVKEINKYPKELLLENTRRNMDLEGPFTPSGLAIAVGMKFLRAVIRQMSVHLSRSGVSYVDLRSRLGSSSQSSPISFGSDQNSNVEFKQKVRMILKSFSWLGIYELVQAAEATVLPVREGVSKAQAKSTRASISNNLPTPNVFHGGRYRGARPGIRVSQYDNRSTNQEAMLRTAFRIPEESQTTPSVRCRGTRLAALSDDPPTPKKRTSSPSLSLRGYSRANIRRTSVIDSDSDTDEETSSIFRNVMDEDSDLDFEENDPSSVAMATGLSREHPYAWALDGRLSGTGESSSTNSLQISFTHYINNINAPPSVHTGNCYLTRMYSRLVKEAVDVMISIQPRDPSSAKETVILDDPVLPVLSISPEECSNIQDCVTSLLNVTWVWLAKVLDVVEGQLQRGKCFDTKRYLSSLQKTDDSDFSPLSRSSTTISGASPEEYLMFLLRSHSNEHSDTLPVIDMLCYEHMVYILDSFLYCAERCTKPEQTLNRSASSISSVDGDESSSGLHSIDISRVHSEPGTSNPQPNPRRMRSKEREDNVKFFGMNVNGRDRDEFLQNLQATLLKKSRMLVPKATWEVFTHNVGTLRIKSVDEMAGKTGSGDEHELPVSIESTSRISYPYPLVQHWSADQIIDRWKISVDLFSRLFLADGPGAERDSFLAARAGVAGRLARFRRTMLYLRESVTADSQQGGLGFGGLGGRVGTTLSIAVKRTRLLEDTLRILGEMQPFHYSNFRARFDGEEGSGPGVNRGFFAAVANALKADNKLPPDTTSLLHEPGKLPEQSGFYSPKPWAYTENIRNGAQLKTRRLKMFAAIGRFLGLSLWFNNTVPLNFSRHVIKVLLDREVTWEDLIFFNADLFEGLSRMMIDAAHPLMTSERFQATYCCHFETSVGGTTEELLPGGSQLPVTPENIFKYVRLYAGKVMTGCVEDELRSMRNGLHDVIPTELLTTLSPEDFQLLLSGGTTDIDISKLRSLITFTNSNGCSKDILERFKRWFWSIVQKMTPLQRQQLLYFCTGSAVLPVMNDRRDPEQDLSVTIDVISGNTKALPMATTCGQRMSIPLYPSKRVLKKKLLQAIQCQSYGLG